MNDFPHVELQDHLRVLLVKVNSQAINGGGLVYSYIASQHSVCSGSQGLISSRASSFRKGTVGHHSNLSIKSLGSSSGVSHDFSAGLGGCGCTMFIIYFLYYLFSSFTKSTMVIL